MNGIFTAVAGALLYLFYWLTQNYDYEFLGWVSVSILLVLNIASGWCLYKRGKHYDN